MLKYICAFALFVCVLSAPLDTVKSTSGDAKITGYEPKLTSEHLSRPAPINPEVISEPKPKESTIVENSADKTSHKRETVDVKPASHEFSTSHIHDHTVVPDVAHPEASPVPALAHTSPTHHKRETGAKVEDKPAPVEEQPKRRPLTQPLLTTLETSSTQHKRETEVKSEDKPAEVAHPATRPQTRPQVQPIPTFAKTSPTQHKRETEVKSEDKPADAAHPAGHSQTRPQVQPIKPIAPATSTQHKRETEVKSDVKPVEEEHTAAHPATRPQTRPQVQPIPTFAQTSPTQHKRETEVKSEDKPADVARPTTLLQTRPQVQPIKPIPEVQHKRETEVKTEEKPQTRPSPVYEPTPKSASESEKHDSKIPTHIRTRPVKTEEADKKVEDAPTDVQTEDLDSDQKSTKSRGGITYNNDHKTHVVVRRQTKPEDKKSTDDKKSTNPRQQDAYETEKYDNKPPQFVHPVPIEQILGQQNEKINHPPKTFEDEHVQHPIVSHHGQHHEESNSSDDHSTTEKSSSTTENLSKSS